MTDARLNVYLAAIAEAAMAVADAEQQELPNLAHLANLVGDRDHYMKANVTLRAEVERLGAEVERLAHQCDEARAIINRLTAIARP